MVKVTCRCLKYTTVNGFGRVSFLPKVAWPVSELARTRSNFLQIPENILDTTLSLLFLFLLVETSNGNSHLLTHAGSIVENAGARFGHAGGTAVPHPAPYHKGGDSSGSAPRDGPRKRPALLLRVPVEIGENTRVVCLTLALFSPLV